MHLTVEIELEEHGRGAAAVVDLHGVLALQRLSSASREEK
jgi:hypothetical protein